MLPVRTTPRAGGRAGRRPRAPGRESRAEAEGEPRGVLGVSGAMCFSCVHFTTVNKDNLREKGAKGPTVLWRVRL